MKKRQRQDYEQDEQDENKHLATRHRTNYWNHAALPENFYKQVRKWATLFLDEKEEARCRLVSKEFNLIFGCRVHFRDHRLRFEDKRVYEWVDRKGKKQRVEKNHKYYIDGYCDPRLVSGTGFVHDNFPYFDADQAIDDMMNRNTWNEHYKYWGLTPEEIKEVWRVGGEAASALGTKAHAHMEDLYNHMIVNAPFTPGQGIDESIMKKAHLEAFLQEHKNYKPYRCEWSLWDKELLLTGTIDMLFFALDETNEKENVIGDRKEEQISPASPEKKKRIKLIMYDWKRCKEIKYGAFKGERGLEGTPCEYLDHCNYNHYCIQLNTYAALLRKNYDVDIVEMALVVLHPNQEGGFEKIIVPDMRDLIDQLFEQRRHYLYGHTEEQGEYDDSYLDTEFERPYIPEKD